MKDKKKLPSTEEFLTFAWINKNPIGDGYDSIREELVTKHREIYDKNKKWKKYIKEWKVFYMLWESLESICNLLKYTLAVITLGFFVPGMILIDPKPFILSLLAGGGIVGVNHLVANYFEKLKIKDGIKLDKLYKKVEKGNNEMKKFKEQYLALNVVLRKERKVNIEKKEKDRKDNYQVNGEKLDIVDNDKNNSRKATR